MINDENELFLALRELIPDLMKETNEYSNTDFYSNKFNLTIEGKSRRVDYPDLLLERSKWEHLKDKKNMYVVSTPKGCWAVDVRVLTPTWVKIYLPSHTNKEFTRMDDYVQKDVYFIPKELMKDISKKMGYGKN